ncbi:hypothetical protein Aduo_006652 [Ancylostoma duodenale]
MELKGPAHIVPNDFKITYVQRIKVLAVFVACSFAQPPDYQVSHRERTFISCSGTVFWKTMRKRAVDKCGAKPTAPAALSMVWNETTLTTCNPTPSFKQRVYDWWGEVKKVGLGTDAAFKPGLENFAVLANGLATRIGCAQKNCNGKLQMACMVYGKAASNTGQAIYEVGTGCSGDQDCTTYAGSKCLINKKFCVAGYPTSEAVVPPTVGTTEPTTTPTTTTTTQKAPEPEQTTTPTKSTAAPGTKYCPAKQDHMNEDPAREHLIEMHNEKRAAIAKEVVMGNKEKARPCPRMKKFVTYNCTFEEVP